MKKIFCLISLFACTCSIGKAQNVDQNGRNNPLVYPNTQQVPPVNKNPVILNNSYNNNNPQQITNTINSDLKPNTMYENNSLQYNKGNNINNNVPQSNGTYYTPGAQGLNNSNSSNGVYSTPQNK